jgi:hypothetical protein
MRVSHFKRYVRNERNERNACHYTWYVVLIINPVKKKRFLQVFLLHTKHTCKKQCPNRPLWRFCVKWKHVLEKSETWTNGINYFADLRMTFRQNFFLQDWFRNEFVVGLG